MAIETLGDYQLHLVAYELPASGLWDPFVTILRFDVDAQDFLCIVDKHHASNQAFASYDEAIDEARRVGTALVEADRAAEKNKAAQRRLNKVAIDANHRR